MENQQLMWFGHLMHMNWKQPACGTYSQILIKKLSNWSSCSQLFEEYNIHKYDKILAGLDNAKCSSIVGDRGAQGKK